MSDNRKREEEDVRIAFREVLGDLRSFKSQQWQVANYTILAEAALWGVSQKLTGCYQRAGHYVVCLLIVGAAAAGIVVLRDLQKAIGRARDRVTKALGSMTPAFRAVIGERPDRSRDSTKWMVFGAPIFAALMAIALVLVGGCR